MKRLLIFSLIAAVGAFVLAFGPLAKAEMPGPDPKAFWNYVTVESPYQKWKMWPDHKGMQPGRAPHGPFHKVYINDVLLKAKKSPAPYGSIQIKENYSKDKKLAAITIMYKVKGYDPKNGDWFWAKYTPKGKAKPYGKVKGCINCHASEANNDYIFVHRLK